MNLNPECKIECKHDKIDEKAYYNSFKSKETIKTKEVLSEEKWK